MKFTYASGSRPLDGYTIQRGLGSGGFGEVYQAVSDGGKVAALKLVQHNLEVELRGVGQCLNLKHPNLLLIYDVKRAENGDRWVVMEYVAGDGLDKAIAGHPHGLPPAEAVAWLRGICAGVGYLHEHGIAHRDLKPSNLFREDGTVKVGDYGLSKFISASRGSGQTVSIGTVHYMAPEMIRGCYGKEIDLYALGIILYEMLTGRVPFDGDSPGEVLMKHLAAAPDLRPLPPAFRSVVACLLEKDPQRRYPSAAALMADVDAVLAGAPRPEVPLAEPAPLAVAPAHEPIPSAYPVAPPITGMTNHYWRTLLAEARFCRPLEIGLRLLIAAFLGGGIGLTAAGIIFFAQPNRHMAEQAAAFLGPGAGLLLSSVILSVLCGALPGPHRWWPWLPALMFGAGAGLSVAGATFLAVEPRRLAENAASFLGPGTGLLAGFAGATALYYLLGSPPRLRLFLALALGAGVGLTSAGIIFLAVENPRTAENAAGFVGPGAGLLACGATLIWLYYRRLARGQHPPVSAMAVGPAPAELGQTSPWPYASR